MKNALIIQTYYNSETLKNLESNMTIDRMIKGLIRIKEKYGDLPIYTEHWDDYGALNEYDCFCIEDLDSNKWNWDDDDDSDI